MAVRSGRARIFPVRVVQQDQDWNPVWLYGRDQDYGRSSQPTLFTQLMGKMQGHLDEMERTRLVLLDAYPMLDVGYSAAGSGEMEGGGTQARKSGPGLRRSGGVGLGRKMRINRLAHHDQHLLSLDVTGFGPEELAVKLEGRKLTVLGKHERKEESSEDGCRAHDYRELHRELLLPEDTDLEAVACSLGHDGQLWVDAPRLAQEEKSIPIAVGRAVEAEEDQKKGTAAEPQQQPPAAPPQSAEENKAAAPPTTPPAAPAAPPQKKK